MTASGSRSRPLSKPTPVTCQGVTMRYVSTALLRARAVLLFLSIAAATPLSATIAFVQVAHQSPFDTRASIASAYASAQTAGDLNVVVISWEASSGSVQSVTDSSGNTYRLAFGPTTLTGKATQSIYYAQNIAAASANTVTITFAAAVPHPDMRIVEYSGIDPNYAFDVGAAGTSLTGTTTDSGFMVTTGGNEVLVGANVVNQSTTGPGSGYTQRGPLTEHADIIEDRIVTTAGSYDATAPTDVSSWWIMQVAAFRAAGSLTLPYPQSSILSSIDWDYSTKQRYAAGSGGLGSDTWDSTWASDGLIYSAWGDGVGFTSSNTQKREMGISTLSGTPDRPPLVGSDVLQGVNNPPECPGFSAATIGGKPEGMLALPGGVIYLHHSTGTDLGGGRCSNSWLAKGTVGANQTWTDHIPASSPIQWPDANGFSPFAFLQYGPAQAGSLAPDSTGTHYIYIYLGNGTPNQVYLARVPAAPTNSIESLANWQYYGTPTAAGDPTWVASSASAAPVFIDANNSQSIGVTFDKAIGRYIAVNDHNRDFEREVSLFDAPSPWGPWTTFDYEEEFDNTTSTSAGCTTGCVGDADSVSLGFTQKWLSADGLSLWAQYSAASTSTSTAYDSLNLVKGNIHLASGSTVKGLALSTGQPAVLDRLSLANPGNLEYIDRPYRWTNVGPYAGVEVIRLPNNDKANADPNYVTFTMTTQQNVCVVWDPNQTVPAWLSGWTLTKNTLNGNTQFDVYMKQFSAGTVTLGGPSARDNYMILVGCN